MLTVTNKTGKIIKQVFIVCRYEIVKGEHIGRLIHMVRSVKQVKGQTVQHDYQVITFNDQDGRTSCDCESRGDCCHKQEVEFAAMRRCDDITTIEAIEAARKVEQTTGQSELLATVNAELAKVNAPAATAEELAATQAKLIRPNDAFQAVYFIQLDRRSAELAKHDAQVKPVATPVVRKVSQDWLLGNRSAGTLSGKPAA